MTEDVLTDYEHDLEASVQDAVARGVHNLERMIVRRLSTMPEEVAARYFDTITHKGWDSDIDEDTGEVTVFIGGKPFLITNVTALTGLVPDDSDDEPAMAHHTWS